MTTTIEKPENDTCEQVNSANFSPFFDTWREAEKFVLQGDLPGVAPDDVQILYEYGKLNIVGRVHPRVTHGRMLRQEYRVGDFERTFSLSDDIDVGAIRAHLDGGVLRVELPFSERVKPRRIEIQAG